jgi:hypothetical protein
MYERSRISLYEARENDTNGRALSSKLYRNYIANNQDAPSSSYILAYIS